MNFLSHALIANKFSTDPKWLLGAMLPDFFNMAGVRLDHVEDPKLQSGIDFHHQTDHAFHNLLLVSEMMGAAADSLLVQGMNKGVAAAIGHVGLELLLDGEMVAGSSMAIYSSAIAELQSTEYLLHFHGQENQPLIQWRKLISYLPTAAIPSAYREPEFVAARLITILSRRPFLAVPKEKETLVYSWTKRAAPDMAQLAPRIFGQVEESLTAIEYEL